MSWFISNAWIDREFDIRSDFFGCFGGLFECQTSGQESYLLFSTRAFRPEGLWASPPNKFSAERIEAPAGLYSETPINTSF